MGAVWFGLGLASGVGIMGFFCDWMLIKAQHLLEQSRELHEEALAFVATPTPTPGAPHDGE